MIFFQRARRAAGAVLAMVLVCALVLPGRTARAEGPGSYSAELRMNLNGQSIRVKLCADLAGALLSAQGQLGAEEQPTADLGLFLGKEAIVLRDSLLLDGTYGIDLEHLAANLPDSVFAPDSGSVLALDRQLYDALLGSGEAEASVGIIGGADGPTALFLTEGPEAFLQELTDAVTKAARVKQAPGKLALESGTVKTTETTVSLDAEGLSTLGRQLLTAAAEDEEARTALAWLLSACSGAEMVEQALADVDAAAASLHDALTQADAHFTAGIAVDSQTKQLLSAFASWDWDGQTLSSTLVYGEEISSMVLTRGDDLTLTAVLELNENTDSALAFRFYMAQGETPNSQIVFRWDKAAGTYVFTTEQEGRTDELTGSIRTSDDTLVITADTANGQALEEFSLTLRRGDPVSVPDFRDIVTMPEEGILQVLQSAVTTARTLLDDAAAGIS